MSARPKRGRRNVTESAAVSEEKSVAAEPEPVLSDASAGSDTEVSEYERLRLRNIQRNAALLEEVDLPLPGAAVPRTPTAKASSPRHQAATASPDSGARRTSARLRGAAANSTVTGGAALDDGNASEAHARQRLIPRLPVASPVEYPGSDGNINPAGEHEDGEDAGDAGVTSLPVRRLGLQQLQKACASSTASVRATTEDYRKHIAKVKLAPSGVKKVVPGRVMALAFHPSSSLISLVRVC
jgi:hypothetical protein